MVQAISLALIDKLGVALSALCLAHCLVIPFVIPFLPAAGLVADESVHFALAAVIGGLALIAFVRGYRRHGRLDIVILGLIGATLVVGALFMHDMRVLGFPSEIVSTVVGGTMLITAHIANFRSCRCNPIAGQTGPCCS